ncbi:hypothetical protein ACFL2I_01095 [Candidatus Omnitrophota bacterium]
MLERGGLEMKSMRVVYTIALIASVTLVFIFSYRYRLKDTELSQYQQLNRYSTFALNTVRAELTQREKELAQSRRKIEQLNETIGSLEQDSRRFTLLKQEKTELDSRVNQLSQEKIELENTLHNLLNKFYSLAELKELIKIAKDVEKQKRLRMRLAKVEMDKLLDKIELENGNRGYLLRAGYSTHQPKIRVEIEPLNKFSNK